MDEKTASDLVTAIEGRFNGAIIIGINYMMEVPNVFISEFDMKIYKEHGILKYIDYDSVVIPAEMDIFIFRMGDKIIKEIEFKNIT